MEKPFKFVSKKTALVKAQNLCANQEKCEFDIRKKLKDWKAKPEDFDEIIELLKKEQFIDEQRYAISYAIEKYIFNKWGKIKIEFTLKQKNIPYNFIQKAFQEIDENKYEKILENELIKKFKSLKDTDEYTIKSKLVRYGLSKGFENGKVFDIVSTILKNNKKN